MVSNTTFDALIQNNENVSLLLDAIDAMDALGADDRNIEIFYTKNAQDIASISSISDDSVVKFINNKIYIFTKQGSVSCRQLETL